MMRIHMRHLSEAIKEHEADWKLPANIIYYLAVAPQFFPTIATNISKNALCADIAKTRIVIEKPFGHDLESAKALNKLLEGIFDEKQIYRIDHYLGKETVQNIMAFRFANALFEPLWNRNYIDHVQISVTEQLGVGDGENTMKDPGRSGIWCRITSSNCFVLLQWKYRLILAQTRSGIEKWMYCSAMRRFGPGDIKKRVVRGQYSAGWMEGKQVPGYREETKVNPESNTETFAAVKFFIDNWRWEGVPFYVRTGKRMQQSSSVITIQYKDVPHSIFPAEASENWGQNRLVISIQPEMSIRLQVQAKTPGLKYGAEPRRYGVRL